MRIMNEDIYRASRIVEQVANHLCDAVCFDLNFTGSDILDLVGRLDEAVATIRNAIRV